MKKNKIVLILVLALLLVSCKDKDERNFDFTLRYNVGGSSLVSSFNNTAKVDTVEGPKVIEFILTKGEKEKIKEKFLELEIMNEDYTFLKKEYMQVTPCEKNDLIVELGDEKFHIEWSTNNIPPFSLDVTTGSIKPSEGYEEEFDKLNKLLELKKYILNIVEESEEYQKLPPLRGYQ